MPPQPHLRFHYHPGRPRHRRRKTARPGRRRLLCAAGLCRERPPRSALPAPLGGGGGRDRNLAQPVPRGQTHRRRPGAGQRPYFRPRTTPLPPLRPAVPRRPAGGRRRADPDREHAPALPRNRRATRAHARQRELQTRFRSPSGRTGISRAGPARSRGSRASLGSCQHHAARFCGRPRRRRRRHRRLPRPGSAPSRPDAIACPAQAGAFRRRGPQAGSRRRAHGAALPA